MAAEQVTALTGFHQLDKERSWMGRDFIHAKEGIELMMVHRASAPY